MGEPVKIVDLARSMIELSGPSVCDEDNLSGDIEIREIGLRPGEKLWEELLIGGSPGRTSHRRIMKANEACMTLAVLNHMLEDLEEALGSASPADMLAVLGQIVCEFRREPVMRDWIGIETARRSRLKTATLSS